MRTNVNPTAEHPRARTGTGAGPGRDRRPSVTDRLAASVADLTIFGRRVRDILGDLRRRPVPTHWTNLFGVVTLACLVVLTVTGLWLMFFYTPSGDPTTYDGGYAPLHGAEVSKAFASTMRITFDIPGGLLMRQAHHWAALLLPASIIMQLLTTFFTGGFRRPRRGTWVLLFLIFVAALAGGWSGYALPDDMLSGTGLRITEGVALGIPVVGTWVASLLFGGPFPGEIIARLYPLHVLIAPVTLFGLIALRGLVAWRVGPAQFPGRGRTPSNVVGVPLLPTAAARAGGLLLIVTGVLLVVSATVTINPIWLYGPASPGDAGAGSQPDWYTGFLDGALRLVPPGWEFVLFDRTWTLAILVPLAVVTAFFVVVAVYPFVEEWSTGDHRDHHLLERPRDAATRTGIGVAGIVFYGTLWAAGSADLIATQFSVTIEGVIATLQVLLLAGPVIGFAVARRVCLGLQRRDRDVLSHGFETGRIVRLPGGEYVEVHRQVGEDQRARMTRPEPRLVLVLRPDDRGRLTLARRLKVRLSRWYLADTIDSDTGERIMPAPIPSGRSAPTGGASLRPTMRP
ncbi:cytochrome b N-terminal domain-containing protein [Agromyces sp. SYSU K20354]|uniref:cytochrome bc1 complex cytochrome b subunit n=1 Tax=Agromyces cavernae TaxID=2898659 RepID=UPI001E4D9254|nr:cytochrome b N-terminal domain-containing protein [Agromyces cavernae]MCD2441447.1 cytochrome b N-terminal domain-containing protein [Agromyces cavernae]